MANWSPDRQQAVQARCDKASDGPWRLDPDPRIDGADQVVDAANLTVCFMSTPIEDRESDSAFIAHARQDLPDALAEIAAKDAEIARLKETSAAAFAACFAIQAAMPDGCRYSYVDLANAVTDLIARQQADLTRLAEMVRLGRVMRLEWLRWLETPELAPDDPLLAAIDAFGAALAEDAKEAARE